MKHTITLRSTHPLNEGVFEAWGMDGKKVFQQKLGVQKGTSEMVIFVSRLAPGLYFYRLTTGDGERKGKFVKQ